MSQFAVVAGNPVKGFQFVGIFNNPHYAAEWADEWVQDSDWWVATVQSNKEYEDGNVQNKVLGS